MTDQELLFIILLLVIFASALLIRSYKKDNTNLNNGLIFNAILLLLSLSIIISGSLYNNPFLRSLFFFLVIFCLLIGIFGIGALIIGLFINSHFVLKRERKSISNLLTLLLGIGLILYFVISGFSQIKDSLFLRYLVAYCGVLMVYFGLSFYNFITVSIFNGFYRPKLNKDYIIVLGSGLVNGHTVSKLLSGRIDKAIEFYRLQKNNNKSSKIIFSGGQGEDEMISEGEAMAKYALKKGLPQGDIIIENKSKTTWENFKYSKEIMDTEKEAYNAIFSTSNYHVFRANIYARMAGLNISGMGSKTALYFLPNALIREYIAIVIMKKRTYLFKILIITIIYIFLIAANRYLGRFVL